MDYLQNHITIRTPNTGGKFYHCRHLVSVDPNEVELQHVRIPCTPDDIRYEATRSFHSDMSEDDFSVSFGRTYLSPTPEMITFLNTIPLKPNGDPAYAYSKYSEHDLGIGFHRKKDAMAFIKQFSKLGKPKYRTNYFKGIYEVYDEKSNKYIDIRCSSDTMDEDDIFIEI